MANPELTVIEVNGVKLEVDLRTAKRVETLRVGDRVKVLKKSYSSSSVYSGVVVGFEPFKEMPTILVAYLEPSYNDVKIVTVSLNKDTKDIEVLKTVDDLIFDKAEALRLFEKQIEKHRVEIADLEEKRSYFLRNFGAYWAPLEKPATTEPV